MSDVSDKTEKATPERRRKARKEGQFARSRDAGGVAAAAGVLLTFAVAGEFLVGQLEVLTAWCMSLPHHATMGQAELAATKAAEVLMLLALPPAAAAALLSGAAGVLQAGWAPNADLLRPRWNRIDPLPRLKSIFASASGATELVMSLARLLVVGAVAYVTVRDDFPAISRLAAAELHDAWPVVLSTAARLTFRATLALTVLGIVDYVISKVRLEKQLRMTKREVRDEVKQQEGDPHVRGQVRRRMQEMTKQALIAQVSRADVVVTNPTHVAVALLYREQQIAPIVTARGYDDVALLMRRLAREAGVPIVENRPLARALAAQGRPGRPIPVELYAAVAEVLAFVYRLRGRRRKKARKAGTVAVA